MSSTLQYRNVTCIRSDGVVANESIAADAQKCGKAAPTDRRTCDATDECSADCQTPRCLSASWFAPDFPPCPTKCGTGSLHQRRQVLCLGNNGTEVKSGSQCTGSEPDEDRMCPSVPACLLEVQVTSDGRSSRFGMDRPMFLAARQYRSQPDSTRLQYTTVSSPSTSLNTDARRPLGRTAEWQTEYGRLQDQVRSVLDSLKCSPPPCASDGLGISPNNGQPVPLLTGAEAINTALLYLGYTPDAIVNPSETQGANSVWAGGASLPSRRESVRARSESFRDSCYQIAILVLSLRFLDTDSFSARL